MYIYYFFHYNNCTQLAMQIYIKKCNPYISMMIFLSTHSMSGTKNILLSKKTIITDLSLTNETRHADNPNERSLPPLSTTMPQYSPLLSHYTLGNWG